mgnify:CR=1 FL=1
MEGRLPDTPWHVGYAKKAEDDPRRHKVRCIHNVDGKCNSSRSNYYMETCGGSSHCADYSETYEDYKKKLEERKTADEIERENIEKYKASLVKKKSALAKSDSIMCHKSTDDLRRCLVCDEGLKKIKFSLKKCTYCGMYYVNLQDSIELDVLQVVKADDVFLMNVPRKKEASHEPVIQVNHGICVYMNKKNKCTNKESKRNTMRCKESGCKNFKRK